MKNSYFKLKHSVTDTQLAEFGLSYTALNEYKAIDKRGRLHGRVDVDGGFCNGFKGNCLIDSRYGFIIPCVFIEGFAEEYEQPFHSFSFKGYQGQVAECRAYTIEALVKLVWSTVTAGNDTAYIKITSQSVICKSLLTKFTAEQVNEIFEPSQLEEPEYNGRGNVVEKRAYVGSQGFFFDVVFERSVTPERIHSDSYTACYACAITLKVWSYAEGDMVTVKCKDTKAFNDEVNACIEFYKEG